MSTISAQQLLLQRTHPQDVKLKMSIFRPTTAMVCRVNDAAITKGARTITFNTVTSGSYLTVQSGMTLLVGTSAGASDVGTVRIRSITSSQIVVAENSNIVWSNGLYLTVLKFFDIVPIFPRITVDASDNITFYKDYDVAYTNQNGINGTFVCAGPHRAVELENGTAAIYYSATGTYNVNNDALTYSWLFEGATITGSTSYDPGLVAYNTPGNYLTKLTTTSSSGAVDSTYRYIVVNEAGGGVRDWKVSSISGGRDSNGYTATVEIHSPLGFDIYPGMPVILTAEEWYGDTKQSIGGNSYGNESVFFVGFILQNTIKYDYKTSTIEFQIGTVSELMKLTNGFAISLEDAGAATAWYQMTNLNLKKAMYHYWKWHSTVLSTCDVEYVGDDFPQQFFDSSRESVFEAVSNVLASARMAELVCDRQGKLWAEVSAKATHNALSAFTPKFTMNADDWVDAPTLSENFYDATSYMELGGIVYNGANTASALDAKLACAPGFSPSERGKVSPITGLSISSQTQLNLLAGDVFAYENARYPQLTLQLRGTRKNLDIAPQEAITITASTTNDTRNLALTTNFFPTQMSWEYNNELNTLTANTMFRQITQGTIGDTILIPIPPTTGYTAPTFNVPNFPTFSFPNITFPGQEVVAPSAEERGILYVLAGGQIWYTKNIRDVVPVWISGSYSLPGVFTPGTRLVNDFAVNNYGDVWFTSNTNDTYHAHVWRGKYDQPKVKVMGIAEMASSYYDTFPSTTDTYGIASIFAIPDQEGVAAYLAGKDYPNAKEDLWYTTPAIGSGFLKGIRTNHGLGGGGQVSYSQPYNQWVATHATANGGSGIIKWWTNPPTTYIGATALQGATSGLGHTRAGKVNDPYTALGIIYNLNGTISRSIFPAGLAHDLDPTGTYILRQTGYGLTKSADAGASFSSAYVSLPTAFFTGIIVNMGTANEWFYYAMDAPAGTWYGYYTQDFGVTWISKSLELKAKIGNVAVAKAIYIP